MNKGKKVSAKQIAETLQCSPATVSMVLKGNASRYRISKETQELVLRTAKQLGYTFPSDSKPESSPIVLGIFLGLVDSAPLAEMLNALNDRKKYGSRPIEYVLHTYRPGELESIGDLILHNSYDGILLLPIGRDDLQYLKGLVIEKPCVMDSQSLPGWNCVVADKIECGAIAARLFIAKGFKKIGLVTRNTLTESGVRRTFGFTSAYEKYGPADASITIVEDKSDGDFGYASMNELLERTKESGLDAVFVTEPNNFQGTFNSLIRNSKSVPDDFELVMFGNYRQDMFTECLKPGITTVGLPIQKMMIDSIDLVCHQIDGGILHGVMKLHYPEMHFRESCPKPECWKDR